MDRPRVPTGVLRMHVREEPERVVLVSPRVTEGVSMVKRWAFL